MGATIAPNCGPDESCVAPLVPDKPAELAKCKDCKDDLVEARLRQLHLDFVDCIRNRKLYQVCGQRKAMPCRLSAPYSDPCTYSLHHFMDQLLQESRGWENALEHGICIMPVYPKAFSPRELEKYN
jgi:hypothetical protein